jgi:hypothetical protein
MKYVDCILAPGTIKAGATVRDGMAWFTLGHFVTIIKPRHDLDLRFVNWTLETQR